MKNPIRNLKIKRRMVALFSFLHFFGNPSANMKVVAVTGTNGKTTTAMLLYRIVSILGYRAGLIGTVENRVGEKKFPVTHTTPDPLQLNKLLKEMKEAGCEYVFMEASSHALHQNRIAGVNLVGGIFTNLTHDHLDYHKNIEDYFKAKKKLFQKLPKDAFALSNADDLYGIDMLKGIRARKFSYGFENKADFYGEIKKLDFFGLEIDINGEKIKSRLLGKFNAYNLLAVWATCKLLGLDLSSGEEKLAEVLESIEPPPGRFEHFMSPLGVVVVVDYAHTPDALEKILLNAKEIKTGAGKIISLVGCGGDRDPLKRPLMGRIGAEFSDTSIFTSDNPRSEDPEKIIEEMKKGVPKELSSKVKIVVERREAIKESLRIAQSGDIIICAGKGHEDYQEIKGAKHHFNDKEEFEKLF